MSEFKGTKWPWKVLNEDDFIVVHENDESVTFVAACVDDEHDAQLIAAAPDLLEVVQHYEKFFEAMFVTCCSNPVYNAWGKQVDLTLLNEAHCMASAAIAKALGEAK